MESTSKQHTVPTCVHSKTHKDTYSPEPQTGTMHLALDSSPYLVRGTHSRPKHLLRELLMGPFVPGIQKYRCPRRPTSTSRRFRLPMNPSELFRMAECAEQFRSGATYTTIQGNESLRQNHFADCLLGPILGLASMRTHPPGLLAFSSPTDCSASSQERFPKCRDSWEAGVDRPPNDYG